MYKDINICDKQKVKYSNVSRLPCLIFSPRFVLFWNRDTISSLDIVTGLIFQVIVLSEPSHSLGLNCYLNTTYFSPFLKLLTTTQPAMFSLEKCEKQHLIPMCNHVGKVWCTPTELLKIACSATIMIAESINPVVQGWLLMVRIFNHCMTYLPDECWVLQ